METGLVNLICKHYPDAEVLMGTSTAGIAHAAIVGHLMSLPMRDGAYANCERLPRESVLAEKMGISRTQLRDILASLEREGFITRRHGVGTIINRHGRG